MTAALDGSDVQLILARAETRVLEFGQLGRNVVIDVTRTDICAMEFSALSSCRPVVRLFVN